MPQTIVSGPHDAGALSGVPLTRSVSRLWQTFSAAVATDQITAAPSSCRRVAPGAPCIVSAMTGALTEPVFGCGPQSKHRHLDLMNCFSPWDGFAVATVLHR